MSEEESSGLESDAEARHKTVIEELSDENLEHLVQQLLLRRQLRKTNIKDQSSTHHSARHATDVNSRREVKKLQSKSKDRSGNVSKYDDEQMMEVFNNLKVRDELHQISERLKQEYQIMTERSRTVAEREKSLQQSYKMFEANVEAEALKRFGQLEKEYTTRIQQLEIDLAEKIKEGKRMKDNYDALKTTNDALKKQLNHLQQQQEKMEKQCASMQARLNNLKRLQDHKIRSDSDRLALELQKLKRATSDKEKRVTSTSSAGLKNASSLSLTVSVLLEWVAVDILRPLATNSSRSSSTAQENQQGTLEKRLEEISEHIAKVLPSLVDLLRSPPSVQVFLAPLQFIYWSLCCLDHLSQQKIVPLSTIRHIREEIYGNYHSGATGSESEEGEVVHSGRKVAYLLNDDVSVRFLSCLILLKTANQVDHIAQVLEILCRDLANVEVREMFLLYSATSVVIHHFRPTQKVLLSLAIDVYLQMSTESTILTQFLESCSTEAWFRTAAAVWNLPNVDTKLAEKLAILLQKLSKIKSNKRYFDQFGIGSTAQEMLRTVNNDNVFLSLNLKSILFTLNMLKPSII